jgi:hypothetical protein
MRSDVSVWRRSLLVATVSLIALTALTACHASVTVGTSNPTTKTFTGHNVSFQYPGSWNPVQLGTKSASQGTPIWTEAFGVNTASFATVAQYPENISITPSNIDQHTSELTTQMQNLFAQAGGSMQSGPTKMTLGGFPALGYSGTAVNPDAVSVKNRIVLAFNGKTEYLVNCQSTGQSSGAIDAGCDQIIRTFTVG